MRIGLNRFAMMVAALVAFAASSAFAQPGGGGFGRGGFGGGTPDPTTYLGQEPVQKELELSGEQKTKVTELADSARQARRELFQNAQGGGGDFQEMQKKMTEMAEANKKKVGEILAPPQVARLDEIMLQVALSQSAPGALSQASNAEKLGLTAEQKQKIADLVQKNQEKMGELFQNAQGDFQGMQEKMTKLREEQKTDAMAVLTAEQKDKLEKLQGKKFDTASIQLRGGFGGGFGKKGGN